VCVGGGGKTFSGSYGSVLELGISHPSPSTRL
jgi:hypothetical protein